MRELLQRALDALDSRLIASHLSLRQDLREALAAPQPEPIAWRWLDQDGYETIQSVKPYHDAEPLYAAPPAAPAPVVPDGVPDTSLVICPNCCTQFRAIPQDVQRLMIDAGFEPPFVAAPVVREPLTDDFIWLLWTRACEKPRLTRDLVCDFARAIEGGGK